MDKLEHIFQLQKQFGSKFTDFDSLDEAGRQAKVLDFIGHCQEELVELRREIPSRKHWSSKKDNPMDQARVLDEYIDVLHFFLTIALCMDWTAAQIYEAYLKKNNVNHERQKDGY